MQGEISGSMKLLYIAVYLWTEYNILTFSTHRLIIRKILALLSGMDKMCSQAYSADWLYENSRKPAEKKTWEQSETGREKDMRTAGNRQGKRHENSPGPAEKKICITAVKEKAI